MVKYLERTTSKVKGGQGVVAERCSWTAPQAERVKIFMCHVESYEREFTENQALNNHLHKVICCLDVSQPLPRHSYLMKGLKTNKKIHNLNQIISPEQDLPTYYYYGELTCQPQRPMLSPQYDRILWKDQLAISLMVGYI